jgi:hypothetical protein
MRDPIQKFWIAKRNKALERLVAAWSSDECPNRGEEDPMQTAADAVTVAHIAAALEWDRVPSEQWRYEAERAVERLVRAWEKYKSCGADDPEVEEELNIALDELAVAHSAEAFEFCGGALKW